MVQIILCVCVCVCQRERGRMGVGGWLVTLVGHLFSNIAVLQASRKLLSIQTRCTTFAFSAAKNEGSCCFTFSSAFGIFSVSMDILIGV